MKNKDKIYELLGYYKDHYYHTLRGRQDTWIKYYDDTFEVPWMEEPKIEVSRTGAGAELVDEPVEQLAAAKLIATRPPLGKTQTANDKAIRVSKVINEQLIRNSMRQNPNPKKEELKNKFALGESWIHPTHNPKWVKEPFDRTGLPVVFLTPDPRIIFASPNEDENGIPEHVIVWYPRMPWAVKLKYPSWTDPERKLDKLEGVDTTDKTVEWLEWWDKDDRVFIADREVVLSSPNPYKFVPFVHKLSGFGKSSHEGKPEDLVVSRIHKNMDLLNRDASITSDIDSSIHMFAHSPIIVTPPEGGSVPEGFQEKFIWKAGHIIENPNRLEIKRAEDLMPDSAIFGWHDRLKADLGRVTPSVLGGTPQGETGRLQDLSYSAAMRKWEGIVGSSEDAWETAIGMALKMFDTIPGLMPDGMSSEDLGKNYVVEIELRAEDPMEALRKSESGNRMQQSGVIDWETNLTKYQGYTVEDAHEVMDNAIVDMAIMTNPMVQQILAMHMARELGMEEELAAMQQSQEQTGGVGSQGGPPRTGNIKTQAGAEQPDLSLEPKPTRRSPNA